MTLLVAALWLCLAPAVVAEENPDDGKGPGGVPVATAAEEPAAEPTVAVIKGHRVNLRVGPRQDVRPVRRLEEGCVLLIVERVPGWVGVLVPSGFPAAVSARYVAPVGVDAVRVNAHKLNLRAHVPEEGRPMPGAFRDHPAFGAVLPLIEEADGWVRVLAPEIVRAYVSERYVRELGPLSKHTELVAAARARRAEFVRKMARDREEAAARASGLRLREALGSAQQGLYRLRIEGGLDRTPIVKEINKLEKAMEADRDAPLDARKLARAIRADLESEIEIRVARKDAEVARLRGLEPEARAPAAAEPTAVVARGEIRWEAAPTWRNGGAFVLWVGDEPTYVLRLTTGLPHPLPDLKGSAGKGERTVEGIQPGDRVFGLPVIEVRKLKE